MDAAQPSYVKQRIAKIKAAQKIAGTRQSEWHEWNGGKCPVAERTRVLVKFRFKNTLGQRIKTADSYHWHHSDSGGDIIAYKVFD